MTFLRPTILAYSNSSLGSTGGDQLADGAMAVGFNVLRALCGPEWKPLEAALTGKQPADTTPYQRFFNAPVRFNRERAELIFSAQWLSQKPPGANLGWHRFVETQIRAKTGLNDIDFEEQVRRVIRSQIAHGPVSVRTVSGVFGMHSRTLSRHLKLKRTSFHDLRNEVMFEIACHLVADSDMPLNRIADALGYGEAAGFTHAFRRWTGSSPAAWRRKARNRKAGRRGPRRIDP